MDSEFIDLGMYFDSRMECRVSDSEMSFDDMEDEFIGCVPSSSISQGVFICRKELEFSNGFFPEETMIEQDYSILFKYGDEMNVTSGNKDYFSFDLNEINVLTTSAITGNSTVLEINYSTVELRLNMFGQGLCKWSDSDSGFSGLKNDMSCVTANSVTECVAEVYVPNNEYRIYAACQTTFNKDIGNHSRFFIKCRETNVTPENERNVMDESYVLRLSKGEVLSILDLSFDDSLKVNLNKDVFEKGIVCGYSKGDGLYQMDVFNYTSYYKALQRESGVYYVECYDDVNKVEANITIS
jgi:hypothetical protein